MRSFDALSITLSDGFATIALNRPAVLNALNRQQRGDLTEAFAALEDDPAVRCIVLRGEGRAFCAGQDQKESAALDATAAHERIEAYARLYDRMRRMTRPLVARLHGPVAGAGFQLALLCDLRIAAEDLRMGMTELNIGSAAIMGSFLLREVVGEAAMKRLVLTGDWVGAPEALQLGLVHEVLPSARLDARVADLAASLAAKPPGGLALTRAWWREMSETRFVDMVRHAHEAHAANFAAGSLTAGARGFLARPGGV
ncbi:enoyl-CoA hydratase/isomerase family protein [Roseomonas sp. AR75]|uniref:enoyl-CoA hydratase/isomerase family protein n=1 Tax=Roseomonas sp. AR75 TaxID=2562311 RepID=UPI0010C051E7|nr:enoyl-CoA hydratase/isomerase family protein [Roseomonas sp. AR75]